MVCGLARFVAFYIRMCYVVGDVIMLLMCMAWLVCVLCAFVFVIVMVLV